MNGRNKLQPYSLALTGLGLLLVGTGLWLAVRPGRASAEPPARATATPDPLATPALPENPTEMELGRYAYYHNCMPCHGDEGQGLTDAWRQVWIEDHQDCWARGCHGGHTGDEGFPLPASIPPIMHTSDHLARFDTAERLLAYLRATHPPQRPGVLTDAEYRALVTLLLAENGRQLWPAEPQPATGLAGAGAAVAAVLAALALLIITILARRTPSGKEIKDANK